MKILWFSNIEISDNINSTGTWVFTMAKALIEASDIELINITEGKVLNIEYKTNGKFKQWIIPKTKLKDGLPNLKIIQELVKIVDEINPDLIHIWGTENFWGLLFSRGILKNKVLIDIQGLKSVCYKYFFTGLNFKSLISCIAFKDFLKPKLSIFGNAYSFKKWGKYELEIIKSMNSIGVQSNWVSTHISYINPRAKLYNSKIQLREPFLNGEKWQKENSEQFRIFTSTSTVISYKGLHILIEALNLLKSTFPTIKLVVAGQISKPGIRQNGYDKFLIKKIKQYNLIENIEWLGSLDAATLSLELKKSNLCVIPSFIESYCVALDEALSLGVPSVVAFSGAMPELACHEISALYYSPTDSVDCACQIKKLFDLTFAEKISKNIIKIKEGKLKINFVNEQLKIYKSIINN